MSLNLSKYLTEKMINRAKKIAQAGGRLYLVGGFVRDLFLGKKSSDQDYCVEGLTAEQFLRLFPQAKLLKASFPVYLLEGDEYAFARREKKVAKGYSGFKVEASFDVLLEEDLKRRDLTINALAIDILTAKLIDPFQGKEDLDKKIIRVVSTSFKEDPLRAYRAARFASQLGFKISQETIELMNKLKKELKYLAKERVFEELKKALLAFKPSLFFINLYQAKILDVHFPEINSLWYKKLILQEHVQVYAHEHTLDSLTMISQLTTKAELRFAILMHELNQEALNSLKKRIVLPNSWEQVANLVRNEHRKLTKWQELSSATLVKIFKKIKRSSLTIQDVLNVLIADQLALVKNLDNKDEQEIKKSFLTLKELYDRLYKETGGNNVDKNKYSGAEFGEKLFAYRCQWLEREKNKLI